MKREYAMEDAFAGGRKMSRSSAFILRLYVLLCVICCTSVQAQTVTPPYPDTTYPSRAAALHACEANIPAAVEYWTGAKTGPFQPPDYVTKTYCDERVDSENNMVVDVNPTVDIVSPGNPPYSQTGYVSMQEFGVSYLIPCSGSNQPASCGKYNPPKNLGCNCTQTANKPMDGDPVNLITGNTYAEQDDFAQSDLTLSRYYNSDPNVRGGHNGVQWLTNYDRNLSFNSSRMDALSGRPSSPNKVTVQRQNGQELTFNKVNAAWQSDADVSNVLSETDDGSGYVLSWTLFVAATRQYETYTPMGSLLSVSDGTHALLTLTYTDGTTQQSSTGTVLPGGLLWKVTDAYGRSLAFGYDSQLNLVSVTEPDGGVLTYSYDTSGNLISVTYPDGKQRQYLYDESAYSTAGSNQSKLTGSIDESGTRYNTFGYQADGRAISTQQGNGAGLLTISYASSGIGSTVTYPLGQQATATFIAPQGTAIISNISARCGEQCDQQYQSQTLDANGYPAVATDFNGYAIKTTYDVNGLLHQRIEASGTTRQRTTNFTWNSALRVPFTRTVLDANGNTVSNNQWVYNSAGQTLARCEIDPNNSGASGYTCSNIGTVPAGVRRWTYTYCTAVDATQCPIVGLTLTATGPRTDTTQGTTYSYYMASSATNCGTPGAACYQAGDLHTVTDAQGHVATIASYDADGRATRITDANGINTDMTYTPRGWLASRSVGGATTSFTYTPFGAVQTVTDADSATTTYGYDAAHRLVKITDAQGNYIQYTLDAAGNKTAEQTYDASGALHKSLTRSFNALGQLTKLMDGLNHIIFDASASNSYDANGNLVQSADGLGIQRQQSYDALNRLVQTIDNYNGTN
jgi:YD repeat-containing protein